MAGALLPHPVDRLTHAPRQEAPHSPRRAAQGLSPSHFTDRETEAAPGRGSLGLHTEDAAETVRPCFPGGGR